MKTPNVGTEIAPYSRNFDNRLQKLADKIVQGKSSLIVTVMKIWYN